MSDLGLKMEIDQINKRDWDCLITEFDDASIYQTWEYGNSGRNNLSHIVFKDGGRTIGCCQVELRHIPLCNIGIAEIHWGPIWIYKNENISIDILTYILRGIKKEYAIKRGYLLKLRPQGSGEKNEMLKLVLEREGFKKNIGERPYRTFKLDLSPPIDELRKNLLQKWRNCLNKAENNQLKVVEGVEDKLYKTFLSLLDEMVERKKFKTLINYNQYGSVQANLPDNLKMKIMICEYENEPVSAAICSAIGNTGIYLFGASGKKGLQVNASYLLQWRMIQWMKEKGIRFYDLGAFNPELNPGVYHFKKGVAGRHGWEEIFIGEYYGCFNLTGKIVKVFHKCVNALRKILNHDDEKTKKDKRSNL